MFIELLWTNFAINGIFVAVSLVGLADKLIDFLIRVFVVQAHLLNLFGKCFATN